MDDQSWEDVRRIWTDNRAREVLPDFPPEPAPKPDDHELAEMGASAIRDRVRS